MTKTRDVGLRRAFQLVQPVVGAIWVILVLSLVLAGMSAVEPLILKMLFDELSSESGRDALISALSYLGGLLLARELLQALTNWLTWRSRLKLQFSLLEATVHRLHNLSVSYHQREGVGATMTRVDRGIQGFVSAFNQVAFQALPAVVYLVISGYFMLVLEWRLALLVLAFAPLPMLLSRYAAPVQTRRERRLLDRWARIYSRFNEVLSGIVTVKSFTREDEEKNLFLRDVDLVNSEVERGVGFDSGIAGLHNLIVAGARVGALAVGGLLVVAGEISVGTLVAFLGYVAGLFGPLQGLASVYQTVRKASVSLETIVEILDAEDDVVDRDDARDAPVLQGAVSFEGVCFGYGPGERELLRGIDVDVRPGERVAIVGPSGSGKTTMMSLLQRFYEPTSGRILVDGHDISELRQRSLRLNIGVVLQDALLFRDTVRNNIAYGRPDAPDSSVSEAARNANAHEMVLRMPRGYATVIGERGTRLSAGERQRIAIARALLKDPPILILDEATSALDAETEHLVQQALDRLTVGRTTFIIAHRLSTVVNAERILVLSDGVIAEQGDHVSLMKAGGYYASLVTRQIGGLLQAG